jgi:ankyrin repeat protein
MDEPDLHTALFAAIDRGDAAEVAALLGRGASPDARDGGPEDTPALVAAFRRRTVTFPPGEHGGRAERFAYSEASLEVMEALLASGASPEAADGLGATPLKLAAKSHSLAAARLLLRYGADPNATDDLGVPPLIWAAIIRSSDPARDCAMVELLLDHGAAIEARNREGCTALYAAAAGARLEVAGVLLERGADPNAASAAGETPLARARRVALPGAGAVAELLERHGAHA